MTALIKNRLGEAPPGASILPAPQRRAAQDASSEEPAWKVAVRLLRFAFPATLILVLSGISLIVDTYFVTGLGSEALAGVSLVFPFYLFLVMAFGGGIGVGLCVVLSVRLGRGEVTAARRAVGSAFALALALAALFMAAFAIGARGLLAQITASAPIAEAAMDFARPLFWGAPIIAVSLTLSNVLRSERRLTEAALMMLLSSIVNAALNPLLIHGLYGAPALGLAGSGVATVIGFAMSAALGATCLLRKGEGRLSLGASTLKLDLHDLFAIARIALPTLGTYASTNSIFLALSITWARFGTDALGSYGLVTRLEYLIAVVVYGVGSALLTLGGEAWGAGRVREFERICAIASGGVVLATSLLSVALLAAPTTWFELFGAPAGVIDDGVRYLQVAAWSYPFYGCALALNYAYQTLGRAHLPLVWSVVRGFGIAVPFAALSVPSHSVSTAAAGVAASLIVLGVVSAAWLRRSVASAAGRIGSAAVTTTTRSPWWALPALPAGVLQQRCARGFDLPRLELVKASAFAVSPYPLSYTLLWPWYFRRPSVKNHTGMPRLSRRFQRQTGQRQRALRICAIGDIMVMQRDRVPVLDPALVSIFSSADVVVGTCEAAIGRTDCDPQAKHHFLFNMPAAYLRGIIAQSGVPPRHWYLSVSNNHSGDIGAYGLASTVQHLSRLGVHPLGARVEGQPPFAVVAQHGMRIGMSAWTHWLNLPEERAWRSLAMLDVPWRALRATYQLDGLVGLGHWEYEWQHFPRAATRSLARDLVAAGYDLLIGSHPHVLQPLEWIEDALCAYSLGNFCSGLGASWAARMCNVLTVDIGTRGPSRGKVVSYQMHLFVQLDDGDCVRLVPLHDAPESLRRRVAQRASLVLSS